MKKLSILAVLFLLFACRGTTKKDYTTVSQVDMNYQTEDNEKKYEVYLRSGGGGLDFLLYTDTQYKVGDTIYFSTKP